MRPRVAIGLTMLCATCLGQQSGDASFAGVALGRDGLPLAETTVSLGIGQSNKFIQATSDAGGKFRFAAVKPGKYQLFAEHDGYVTSPGRSIEFAAEQVVTDYSIALIPYAEVSGRVLDEDGTPLRGFHVWLEPKGARAQGKRLARLRGETTDAEGRFHLNQVIAGEYVAAGSQWGGMAVRPFRSRPANLVLGEDEMDYVQTYYPGVTEPESAAKMRVMAGAILQGLEFPIQKKPVYRIRGTVAGELPGMDLSKLRVSVMGIGTLELTHTLAKGGGASNIEPDGTFDLGTYPPGSYFVRVTALIGSQNSLGQSRVELGKQDKDNVAIALRPLTTVSGTMEWESSEAGPAILYLDATDGSGTVGKTQNVRADRSFVIEDVPPGNYRLQVLGAPPGKFLDSILLHEQDILASGFEVNSVPLKLRVVFRRHPGRISGRVTDGTNAVSGAKLTWVPEGPGAWVYSGVHIAITGANGSFTLGGLRPGRYRLYAFEEVENEATQDAEFLGLWGAKSVVVDVKEDGFHSVELVCVSAAEVKARR